MSTDEITLECWALVVQPKVGYLLNKGAMGDWTYARSYDLGWLPALATGYDRLDAEMFLVKGAQTSYAGLSLPAPRGKWSHYAVTFSSKAGVIKGYVNGILKSMATNDFFGHSLVGQEVKRTDRHLLFGSNEDFGAEHFMGGYLDEVRIWSEARTAEDIYGSMHCRLTGSESNLVGYWNFDAGDARDLTANGHNGTLMASAQVAPISGEDAVSSGACDAAYPLPPLITGQPRGRFVLAGCSVGLAVSASSKLPMSYQWQLGSNTIPGATADILWVTNVQVTQSGSYSVMVRNEVGTTRSQAATLTVTPYSQSLTHGPANAGGSGNLYTYTAETHMNWSDAEAEAASWNGHLASITSSDEQDFLQQYFLTADGIQLQEPFWIGLSDTGHPGTFGWSRGEPLEYANWSPGEPSSGNNAVAINWHFAHGYGPYGTWSCFPSNRLDTRIPVDSGPYYGIIEISPRSCIGKVVIINGFCVGATLIDGGAGYTNTPTVRVIGGSGNGAQAVAVVSNGVVAAVNLLTAGSGYTTAPVIVIAPPFIPQPSMAITALLFGPLTTPVIKLDLSNLSPYDNYQLEFSPVPAGTWANLGAPFIATASKSTQYANGSGGTGFFRLIRLP